MALIDPIAVYNAASNLEAHLVCDRLNEAGVEAFLTEDISLVGTWAFGLLPEIHKPQVWVDRSDSERAVPILEEYERIASDRRKADAALAVPGRTVLQLTCAACCEMSMFPIAQVGSVQLCPVCGAYMDVEDEGEGEGAPFGTNELGPDCE